jgi:diguanylate cyclase (GGDEF)-like protein
MNRYYRGVWAWMTLVLTAGTALSYSSPPPKDLKFTQLGIAEGLSQGMINAILQDRKGFIWFATKDGLNRYDGYRFISLSHEIDNPDSLAISDINELFEDREGTLWVGTNGGGLDQRDAGGERFVHFRHAEDDPLSIDNDYISAIGEDGRGNIWVGTEKGLDYLRRGTGEFIHFRPDPADRDSIGGIGIQFIAGDEDGRIWVGIQDGGLDCYDPRTGRFRHYRHDPSNPASLDSDAVTAVCLGPGGEVWVGTDTGLNLLDPATGRVVRFQDPSHPIRLITGIDLDRDGHIWANTFGDGLFCLERTSGTFVQYRSDPDDPESLGNNTLNSLLIDKAGILWVGSNGFGISKTDLERKKFVNYRHDRLNPNSPSFSSVRCIFQCRDGALFVGGYGGLDRLDRKSEQWKHIRLGGVSAYNAFAMCPCSDDEREGIWIGTEGDGLLRYNPVRRTLRPASEAGLVGRDVYALRRDGAGGLWIGTNLGLNRFDPREGTFRFYGLGKDGLPKLGASGNYEVRSLHKDRDGILWVGTSRLGIFAFDQATSRFRRLAHAADDPRSLSNNFVLSLYEDGRGRLWTGTNGGGLNLLNRSEGTFSHLTKADGLPNDVVYGILEDDEGNLWLSTNLGISKFNPEKRTFRNFDERDGLIGNEFNSCAYFKDSRSGEMFFGGVDGVTAFRPGEIKDNPYVPSIVITDFKIFNRSVKPGPNSVLKASISDTRDLKLSYRDSMISFEFVGLHYAAPEKNLYAYKLEGFDGEWNLVDAARRFAIYTNLKPGRYLFRVKGSNGDGVWNETGVSLPIRISPPFWRTWWFICLSAALIGAAALAAYLYRIRQLKNRERHLTRLVEQRTDALNRANEQLAAANQELERLTLTDPLTQLPNRRNFEIIFDQEWKRCSREAHPLSILVVDIDFFKLYNDRYGHLSGDHCLQQVAASLQRCACRAGDFVARVGGEEFVAVLSNTPSQGAAVVAERMRRGVEELCLAHHSSAAAPVVTVSIGVVTVVPGRDQSGEALIAAADRALYRAKEEGRNRVQANDRPVI